MSAPVLGVVSPDWIPARRAPASAGGEVEQGAMVAGLAVEVHQVGETDWWVVTAYGGTWASQPMLWLDLIEVVVPLEEAGQ